MDDLHPRQLMDRITSRWYLIFLGVVLGGISAWLFGSLLHPVYEAHADVYINLDSTLWAQEAHVGEPVEVPLATSMVPIYELFYAPETLAALMDVAAEDGIVIDEQSIYENFTVQRVSMTWLCTVRAGDPQAAARLADLWVQVALPIHQEAHTHALAAYALILERDALAACFEGSSLSAANTCAGTSLASLGDLAPALAELEQRIAAERALAMGLDPALTLDAGSPAVVPVSPVRFARTWLALAGAGIGLILGIVAAQVNFLPSRKHRHAR